MAADVRDGEEPGKSGLVAIDELGEVGGGAVGGADGKPADNVVGGLDGDPGGETVGEGGGQGGLGVDGGMEEVEFGDFQFQVEVGEDDFGEIVGCLCDVAVDVGVVRVERGSWPGRRWGSR